MGLFKLGFVGLILGGLAYLYIQSNKVVPVPKLGDVWWGKGDPSKEDKGIKPFKIDVSESVINDLRYRLEHAPPFEPPLEGVGQNYGINTKLLEKIVAHWKTKYDWSERQKFLNQFPQYTTSIQGLKIHYIHVKPKAVQGARVVPLLLLHGWPGSVREFYEIIPLLTTPQKGRKVVFEIIAPSLPGYGFSEGTSKPGLGTPEMAVIFKNLMKRLGFQKYYIQGGDWGALIVQHMAIQFPDQVLAVHSNMCSNNKMVSNFKIWVLGSLFPSFLTTEQERELFYPPSQKIFTNVILLEMGYFHIQATKPDTVGVGLRDSPVGLAAYIIEKFITWTDSTWKNLEDGGLTKKFTYDQLLDNVMIYWVSRSATTSMRLYAQFFSKSTLEFDEAPVTIPAACARFRNEIVLTPESVLRDKYLNLTQVTLHPDGGHFAAFEVPALLAKDVYDFVETLI
ncbi:juvenile hormone epoxide hydrolase 1-like [Cylas formicarius]|uniref:juvenile hormone epoxide hydrolase 1-like n=1 Tax=Cylas formicarius TaxID=197179 RepID=UPI0029585ABD|nr:juvenile hormone epoxide hydrolase 1-like [Cylas formicarius]